MLTSLRIKNLALVADLTLDLQPGYNVITGETGAGKSMLIGALNLVLGERADRGLIRAGTDACSVEGVFDIGSLRELTGPFLEEHGLEPCEDHQLIIKRVLTSAGANRQFINGSPTSLAVLGTIGEWLVDIHGPHEHQSLLHPARQLALLDAFGKTEPAVEGFASLLAERSRLEKEKASLVVDEQTYQRQLDLLRFQSNEIRVARLQPQEEEQVEADYRRASNAAKLLQLSQTALDLLSENESSLLAQAGALGRTLQDLRRVDPGAEELVQAHEHSVESLRDLQSALSSYSGKLDLDPEQLQTLEERLNLIHSLKRKYGASIDEVIAFGEDAAAKLAALESRDVELERLNAALAKNEAELWRKGQELSAQRRKAIPQLCRGAVKQLGDLGFKQSRLDITIQTASREELAANRVSSTGLDTIEFVFAPNPGEPAQPLRSIASSGELARVMLALKTVLAVEDKVPVLVFDEVDANVGGETALAVGEKMRQISKNRQVLCITHLPQVAAPAAAHYVAEKHVRGGRTVSEIRRLEKTERVTEIARMLGGQTDAARKHAEAMLK